MTTRQVHKITVAKGVQGTVCDLLAAASGLSRMRVKKAMNQGAAWLQRPGGRPRRIRRASAPARAGDSLALYYDEHLSALSAPRAECLEDRGDYSIWFKPAGLLTQGSRFGDHLALTRQAEAFFKPPRPILLVHRLDREAGGLVLLAHNRPAAAALSALLRRNEIEKEYQLVVRGKPAPVGTENRIGLPLGEQTAESVYRVMAYDPQADRSTLRVRIKTGRRHQIRRHLAMIGNPVMGDPLYGHGNKNRDGLQLVAFSMRFKCPLGKGLVHVAIDPDRLR